MTGSPSPPLPRAAPTNLRPDGAELPVGRAAALDAGAVLAALDVRPDGLAPAEAARRRALWGPNAVRTHHARALGVLGHQLRSALLVLLLVTAVASFVLGERTDARSSGSS